MQKMWRDVAIGDTFPDGSHVMSLHQPYLSECYEVSWFDRHAKGCMVLSSDHLLLCDISHLEHDMHDSVYQTFANFVIPTLLDKHVYMQNLDNMDQNSIYETYSVVDGDRSDVSSNLIWLPVNVIFQLVRVQHQTVLCNGKRLEVEFAGKRKVFCVETDTHQFETCGLIHHNSVTLRNIIFHCLTHGERFAVALVDLKFTEFESFKGMKNVVAVANTVADTVEVLRVAREVLQKRNQELAKLGLVDIKDFKPQQPTNEVIVAGRLLHDGDQVEVQIGEETKTIDVKDLEQYLQ
jgi:hypothetical protein